MTTSTYIIQSFTRSLVLVLVGFTVHAQEIKRYNSFSFNVNEGLLQSNVLDLEFDKNNFGWLSFANGIQKFDGKNFTDLPVQPGLPDDKWVDLFRCTNGDLLIGHSFGVSKYDIETNRFKQVYTIAQQGRSKLKFIGEDEELVYFLSEKGVLTGMDSRSFKVISETASNLPGLIPGLSYNPKISDNIICHRIAVFINDSLFIWDLKKQQSLQQVKAPLNMVGLFLRLKSENEVLYYIGKEKLRLQQYDFVSREKDLVSQISIDGLQTFRSNIYQWDKDRLLSYKNRLFETDSLFGMQAELVNYQNQPIAGNATIALIREDNFGNLCLVTINDGFRKIIPAFFPIKYFASEKQGESYTLALLPDKQCNRILVGTYGNGLMVFDTLQRLTRHIRNLPGSKTGFSPNIIVKSPGGDYLVLAYGEQKAWRLSSDLSRMRPIDIITKLPENKRGVNYFTSLLYENEQTASVLSQGHLFNIDFVQHHVSESVLSANSIMGGLYYKDELVIHHEDELVFFNARSSKEVRRVALKNTGGVRCFTQDKQGHIYVGSNKGIFKIDSAGNILDELNKEKGLPDECIYAMVIDDEGYLWCSTNKGIFKISNDKNALQLTREDGLQENEFNTNVVAKTSDGEIFFGGVNGVNSFFPEAIGSPDGRISLVVTNIKVNNENLFRDTSVWNINRIELPHHENLVSFDFIAMGGNNPGSYIYQYRMKGIDKEWIQNNSFQTVRYFLPPGKYTFQLYASRMFNKSALPLKEIQIHILPPFYKTWWFMAGLAVLLVAALAYFFNYFNHQKYQSKLAVLEDEHKIRQERERISRDLHDSIGAYANAVLYNAELLEKEKDTRHRAGMMRDLKFASKDIITSLRETIWALKKDNYSAEDCLLRMRNFIQPFNRFYVHINFSIEGEAPAGKMLHYTAALNLVRIVQEAVTNAIKHGKPKNIRITSTRNPHWEIAIRDDGMGFNDSAASESEQSNGLHNMKQRAAYSMFVLEIRSTPGMGTAVIVRI